MLMSHVTLELHNNYSPSNTNACPHTWKNNTVTGTHEAPGRHGERRDDGPYDNPHTRRRPVRNLAQRGQDGVDGEDAKASM